MGKEFWQWWNWLWSEAGGAWAGVAVGTIAAAFAIRSWQASVAAIRSGYRPLIRPVRPTGGSGADFRLLVSNHGRGPAIGMLVLDPGGKMVTGLDVVEPIVGNAEVGQETEAIGTRGIKVFGGEPYRILYQDLGGRWHETSFFFAESNKHLDHPEPHIYDVQYHGPRRSGLWRPQIPAGIGGFLSQNRSKGD